MKEKLITAIVVFGALSSSALAEDASIAQPPTFAQLPPPPEPSQPNPWSGLFVGSEVFGVSGKGVRGGAGGDGFLGYDRALDNNVFLSIRASAGYSPALFAWCAQKGFDFAMTQAKISYDAGRWKPFVTVGLGLAKANSVGFAGLPNAGDSINNLFSGSSSVKPLTAAGAGVDYAVTDNITISASVSVVQNRGFGILPPP